VLGNRFAIPCLVLGALLLGGAHAASNVVQYSHDAAGNIIAIQRVNPAPITLSDFSPGSGPSGTAVTITGSGFSATAALNSVSFNGVAAAVSEASATSLTATVPAGASTGRVAVTVGGNTTVSALDFVVTTAGGPTIASFMPASGAAGTVVTVSGTNFNPAAGATTVKLNQSPAAASSVTATSISFTVPPGTGSGRIAVSTGGGTGVGATDFIVPPGGIATTDILATTRLVTDGPARSLGLYATNKYGIVLFDGAAGAWLSVHVANFTITPASSTIAYTIYKPDNTQLATGTLSAANLSIHLPALPMAGTYSLLLRTGLAQVSLDTKVETNRFVSTDAPPLDFARGAAQSTRVLIAAVAGEQKALMVAGLATTPANATLDVQILLPNGSMTRRTNASGLGTTTPLAPFAVTGTYQVMLVPPAGLTQSTYKVGLLLGSSLAIDGPPADVAIANPGEAARLTFTGVAGDNLGLGVSGVALNPSLGAKASVAAYKPDGSLLASTVCSADGTSCAANLDNLPVSGAYTVIVQPVNGATGMQRLWLSRDIVGTLVSGAPLNVALPRPGHNARLTFEGTAGSVLALQVRSVATNPAGQGLLVLVNQPSKSMIAYTHLTGPGQTVVTPALPVTGTYTVFIEPEPAALAAATATMEVLLDPGRALEIDGATQSAAIAVAGGSARFLFSAAAGQNLGLGIGNLVLSPAGDAIATIHKPDGVQLTSYSCTASLGACGGNLLNLPATGTYSVVVRPLTGATGSVGATLSSDLAGTITVDGSPFALNLDRLGRNARLSFAGSAGQTLRLSWSGVASVASYTYVYVLSPAGSTIGLTSVLSSGTGTYDIPALPATGTYTLFIDPPAFVTLNATVRITPR
jgi:hypothetical protein